MGSGVSCFEDAGLKDDNDDRRVVRGPEGKVVHVDGSKDLDRG